MEAGRDSHLGAVNQRKCLHGAGSVDTTTPRPPASLGTPSDKALFPPCLCSLPLLVHNCRLRRHRATDSLPPSTAGLARSSHREAFPTKFGQDEDREPRRGPQTSSSWFGLRLAHGLQSHPAPSDASWLPHSGCVWHMRPLES